jgi:tetratricopeptide (TPR) repeat protein
VDLQFEIFEHARNIVRGAPKEKKMKRNLSLWLGLLSFALVPVLAQTPAPKGPTGKIHGRVTNPTGLPATSGTISLSTNGGSNSKATFTVDAQGDYSGEAAPGIYTLVYRAPDTPPDKVVDQIDDIKVLAGQDTAQDDDMSRKEFIDKNLTSDQKKQLEELKKHNAEALKANAIIAGINADIKASMQDFKDADGAYAAAAQALGAGASRADIDAKEAEIKTAKFSDVETLMLKDTAAKPDASVLWAQLGQAQVGLKKYDDAEASYKKALEVETTAKKPSPMTQGAADAGLGEIYARTGKVAEANAAYDAAVKIYPEGAFTYLRNEAIIFSQVGNGDAQAAAADEAIKADPTQPIPYYLKGQGLIQKASIDPATGKMILPPGCEDAYRKYLELAPNGSFANDVKGILAEATQTHSSSVANSKPKKNK